MRTNGEVIEMIKHDEETEQAERRDQLLLYTEINTLIALLLCSSITRFGKYS